MSDSTTPQDSAAMSPASAGSLANAHSARQDAEAKIIVDGIAEIMRIASEPDWIPVTERLPPVDEKVLYTCLMVGDGPEDYFTDVNAGYWDGKTKNLPGDPAMKYDDSNDWEPCSHWMPLPAPPADPK